jgi:exonuclease III
LLQLREPCRLVRRLKPGWANTHRALHPKQAYIPSDYMRQRWERDMGFRLDFLLLMNVSRWH